jgi:hypothetical protein
MADMVSENSAANSHTLRFFEANGRLSSPGPGLIES